MLILIISRPHCKLGHIGSKAKSLAQIIEKPCVHSRGHSFESKFVKLCQNVNPNKILIKFKTWTCWVKPRSLGQIIETPCVHSVRNGFDSKFLKLCQNVNPY